MGQNYSKEIVGEIRNFLETNDWKYSFDKENGVLRFNLRLKGKIPKVSFAVDVQELDFNVFAIPPISADYEDAEVMKQMSEFLTRANYGLRMGNFEMDFRDGEFRYKCYVDCNGITPTEDMIANSICCPARMFERYGKGMVQILFNDMDAWNAIVLCEGNSDAEQSTETEEETETPAEDEENIEETESGGEDTEQPTSDKEHTEDDMAEVLEFLKKL